jgi:hypothetical protein
MISVAGTQMTSSGFPRARGGHTMPEQQSKLISKVVLIFEMQGIHAVEQYAKANNIPLEV